MVILLILTDLYYKTIYSFTAKPLNRGFLSNQQYLSKARWFNVTIISKESGTLFSNQ